MPGVRFICIIVGQGPVAVAIGAGMRDFGILLDCSILAISVQFPSLLETA